MLPPDYLLNIADDITLMYADLHTAVISDIAMHIKDTLHATGTAGIIPSAMYQIERLNQAGLLREQIVKRVAKTTKMSRTEVRKLFREAAIKTRVHDDRVYKAAGLDPVPVMQSPSMLQILNAGIRKAEGAVRRLTNTTATNAVYRFEELVNVAYGKVATGSHNYQQAIMSAVDELARAGVTSMDYASGRRISIEAGVRRAVLTGVNQTAAEITMQTMADMHVSLVRTSAHLGARNKGEGFINHESWQGRVYSMSGATADYEDFYAACGYGDVQGICGANCRHSFGVYIEGLSPETYSEADLDEYANATVTYNGEEIPYYDATQRLRALERKVRHWDRKYNAKAAAGLDASHEKAERRAWRHKIIDFTEQTGIKRDYVRERAAKG